MGGRFQVSAMAESQKQAAWPTSSASSEDLQQVPSARAVEARAVEDCRTSLLDAVAAIAPTLHAGAIQSDIQGRLVEATVDALRANGLWRLRLCRELGGFELPIVAQIQVLSALAAEDASSAWCTMVANNAVATLGATMPPAAIDRVFADGVPVCSIVAAPGGVATPVEGGYQLNGTWRLASAVQHASWVHATALIERDPSRLLQMAIPARDLTIIDSWNVVGLSGTGSKDFTLQNYFLPAELAGNEHKPYCQIRGLRRYDLAEVENVESYEHLAFAIGIGRRALRELRSALVKPVGGRYIADREVVQGKLGQAAVKLQAAEALALLLYERIDAAAVGQHQSWSYADRHLPRALAVWATDLALECTQLAFQRSGSVALHQPNVFEKLLRDMHVAAKHIVVDDAALASYALHLVETGGPMELSGRASAIGTIQ